MASNTSPTSQARRPLGKFLRPIGIFLGVSAVLAALLYPAVREARHAAIRSQITCNLKQLQLAVHNYHDTYGTLPPAYLVDKEGRPAHSWRVLVLPFLEHQQLYEAYNFEQPWNSPDNAKLADQVYQIFRRPEDPRDSKFTRFVAVVGPETVFPGARALSFDEIGDGLKHTIGFVEIDGLDIPWMEPRDLRWDRMSFQINDRTTQDPHIGSPYGNARVAFMDGAIVTLKDNLPPKTLKALLTANGGEPISDSDY